MVFWRKKNNSGEQDRQDREDRMLHRANDPAIEPPTDYDPEIDPVTEHELEETESEILEELDYMPVPRHGKIEDAMESEDLRDHSEEGGWLSRLTRGLSKSTNKITQGLSDLAFKKKLDQDMLDELEEVLIAADLGPKTAAHLIQDFSKDRFGKDISEQEIREALAGSIAKILEPIARQLEIKKPTEGPFVILVCGVNGVGKTTTIGKLAQHLKYDQGHSVMMAAGDTFRAAATEQLQIWANRVKCKLFHKEVGADAAAVAFEAYAEAKKAGVEVLMIDTAGRLQNKANLMAELEKIIRVLKKQNDALPHEVLLVLDSTTGQNAFSQLETFKEMVNVTGLAITKLDGSAKGGVLVGLADQYKVPVYALGVGEALEDMQPFIAAEYARSLMGLRS